MYTYIIHYFIEIVKLNINIFAWLGVARSGCPPNSPSFTSACMLTEDECFRN